MELYLIQHGEAKSESEDPTRPLTDRGREEVRRVADFAARIGLHPAEIRHSGKRRAEETALIFAEALFLKDKIRTVPGLAPNDDVRPLAEQLDVETQSLMVVGHLPFLSRLVSLLLVDNPDRIIVRFRMGGIVCLVRGDSAESAGIGRRWELAWIVTPDIIGPVFSTLHQSNR
ncbi:MAG TPA: phosphohistidine phosphatase SixA [Candidatus Limnocylindrales bacterium]|nr:phosphohistidine phosphatase SixA [Candidatus Limnocylindrales bacterium]